MTDIREWHTISVYTTTPYPSYLGIQTDHDMDNIVSISATYLVESADEKKKVIPIG
jgi:hypothetical protein